MRWCRNKPQSYPNQGMRKLGYLSIKSLLLVQGLFQSISFVYRLRGCVLCVQAEREPAVRTKPSHRILGVSIICRGESQEGMGQALTASATGQ